MKIPRISDRLRIKEKTFETEVELAQYLREKGFSEDEISETVLHERAHFNAATERGYASKYGFRKTQIIGIGTQQVCFIQCDREIRPEDRRAIYLAPVKPSFQDRCNASEPKEQFKWPDELEHPTTYYYRV